MRKNKRFCDSIIYMLIYFSASVSVLILAGIICYVFCKGLRGVTPRFLTSVTNPIEGTTGIAGNILNTLYIVVITLVASVPVGIGSAIYLNEYAKSERAVKIIEFTTETLTGIPSVIFGMFGMIFFGTVLGLKYSILTGALTMTLMVLPLITRNTQEALKMVPESYRSGSVGLGATKWHLIRTILLPSAMPGIVTGIILAIGRIVGESAVLLFTSGSGYFLPKSFAGAFTKIFESGGTLTVQLYLNMSKGQYDTAFSIAAVLLIIVLLINLCTKLSARQIKAG